MSLNHNMDLPLDERCKGCPVILAEETSNGFLYDSKCPDGYTGIFSPEDEGCTKGQLAADLLLHVTFREFPTDTNY